MRINEEQLKNLPDGTKLKIFLSGSKWDKDFGKVFNAIKFGDYIYEITGFYYTEEKDEPGYEFEVALKEDILPIKGRTLQF